MLTKMGKNGTRQNRGLGCFCVDALSPFLVLLSGDDSCSGISYESPWMDGSMHGSTTFFLYSLALADEMG